MASTCSMLPSVLMGCIYHFDDGGDDVKLCRKAQSKPLVEIGVGKCP